MIRLPYDTVIQEPPSMTRVFSCSRPLMACWYICKTVFSTAVTRKAQTRTAWGSYKTKQPKTTREREVTAIADKVQDQSTKQNKNTDETKEEEPTSPPRVETTPLGGLFAPGLNFLFFLLNIATLTFENASTCSFSQKNNYGYPGH